MKRSEKTNLQKGKDIWLESMTRTLNTSKEIALLRKSIGYYEDALAELPVDIYKKLLTGGTDK